MSKQFKFDPNNKDGLNLKSWAKFTAYKIIHGEGNKSVDFLRRNIVDEKGQQVFKQRTWKDFHADVRYSRYEPPQLSLNVNEKEVVQFLKSSEDENKFVTLTGENHQPLKYMRVPIRHGVHSSTIRRNNDTAKSLFNELGENSLKEFLQDSSVSQLACDVLSVPGRLGPETSTNLKNTGQFTYSQIVLMKQAGFVLSSFKSIREVEDSRDVKLIHMSMLLVSKPKENEKSRKENVNLFYFILFYLFIFLSFLFFFFFSFFFLFLFLFPLFHHHQRSVCETCFHFLLHWQSLVKSCLLHL